MKSFRELINKQQQEKQQQQPETNQSKLPPTASAS